MAQLLSEAEALKGLMGDLTTVTVKDLVSLWRNISKAPDAAIEDALKVAVPQIVMPHVQAAAEATAQWYDEIVPTSDFKAVPFVDIPEERINGSIAWAVNQKGTSDPLTRLTGASKRMVMDGSRQTVLHNASKENVRWVRHAQPDACLFCKVLATRGEVYTSFQSATKVVGKNKALSPIRAKVGQQRGKRAVGSTGYHDHCRCVAVPVRKGKIYVPPDYVSKWDDQYGEARKRLRKKDNYAPTIQDVVAEMRLMEKEAKLLDEAAAVEQAALNAATKTELNAGVRAALQRQAEKAAQKAAEAREAAARARLLAKDAADAAVDAELTAAQRDALERMAEAAGKVGGEAPVITNPRQLYQDIADWIKAEKFFKHSEAMKKGAQTKKTKAWLAAEAQWKQAVEDWLNAENTVNWLKAEKFYKHSEAMKKGAQTKKVKAWLQAEADWHQEQAVIAAQKAQEAAAAAAKMGQGQGTFTLNWVTADNKNYTSMSPDGMTKYFITHNTQYDTYSIEVIEQDASGLFGPPKLIGGEKTLGSAMKVAEKYQPTNTGLQQQQSSLDAFFKQFDDMGKIVDFHGGPNPSDLTFTGKTLGGVHGAKVYKDPSGQMWVVKENSKFLSDLDVATAKLQQAAGLTTPDTYSMVLNGKSVSVQRMFDSKDAFSSGSALQLDKLSDVDLLTIQQHQIFDWLISNHDAHSGNWLKTTDGNLVGIDKGQAFKFFGKDKLDWNYVPVSPLGGNVPTYKTIWQQWVSGKAKTELLDPGVPGPLNDFINLLMSIDNQELRDLFTPYAKQALAEGKLSTGNVSKFLDNLVARKEGLLQDFKDLYAKGEAERLKNLGLTAKPKPAAAATQQAAPTTTGVVKNAGPFGNGSGVTEAALGQHAADGTLSTLSEDAILNSVINMKKVAASNWLDNYAAAVHPTDVNAHDDLWAKLFNQYKAKATNPGTLGTQPAATAQAAAPAAAKAGPGPWGNGAGLDLQTLKDFADANVLGGITQDAILNSTYQLSIIDKGHFLLKYADQQTGLTKQEQQDLFKQLFEQSKMPPGVAPAASGLSKDALQLMKDAGNLGGVSEDSIVASLAKMQMDGDIFDVNNWAINWSKAVAKDQNLTVKETINLKQKVEKAAKDAAQSGNVASNIPGQYTLSDLIDLNSNGHLLDVSEDDLTTTIASSGIDSVSANNYINAWVDEWASLNGYDKYSSPLVASKLTDLKAMLNAKKANAASTPAAAAPPMNFVDLAFQKGQMQTMNLPQLQDLISETISNDQYTTISPDAASELFKALGNKGLKTLDDDTFLKLASQLPDAEKTNMAILFANDLTHANYLSGVLQSGNLAATTYPKEVQDLWAALKITDAPSGAAEVDKLQKLKDFKDKYGTGAGFQPLKALPSNGSLYLKDAKLYVNFDNEIGIQYLTQEQLIQGLTKVVKAGNDPLAEQWIVKYASKKYDASTTAGQQKIVDEIDQLKKQLADEKAKLQVANSSSPGSKPSYASSPSAATDKQLSYKELVDAESGDGLKQISEAQLVKSIIDYPPTLKQQWVQKWADANGLDSAQVDATLKKLERPDMTPVIDPTVPGEAPKWDRVKNQPSQSKHGLPASVQSDATATPGTAENPHIFMVNETNDWKTVGRYYTDQNKSSWSSDVMRMIANYTGGGYRAMNNALRAGRKPSGYKLLDSSFTSEQVKLTDDWMVLTRGDGGYIAGVDSNSPTIDQLKAQIGKEVNVPGYVSTSITEKPAFSGSCRIIFKVPPKSKILYVDGAPDSGHHLSTCYGEREVVLPRGMKVRVIDVQPSTATGRHKYDVVVEIIEQKF